MTITEFVTARLNEVEATAQYSGPARVAWLTYRNDDGQMHYTTVAASHGDYDPWTANGKELPEPASVRVIYDPARVLREVEAKRKILAEYVAYQKRPWDAEGWVLWNVACWLAAAWNDHSDWRQDRDWDEWGGTARHAPGGP